MVGNILLTLALLTSIFSMVLYYLSYKGYTNTLKKARIGYYLSAVFVIAASIILLNAILTHQYQYKYIFDYSGKGLSTGLLISTFYAGQQGSFMLWTLFTAVVGVVLLNYTSKRGDLEQRVMLIFTFTLAFLLVMVSPLLKSPFNYIWTQPIFINIKKINPIYISSTFLQGHIFQEPGSNQAFVKLNSNLVAILQASGITLKDFIINGKGLNPLLQNFWMQIHPPILFLGFSLSTVPYAFAISALLKNDYKAWISQAFPWLLSAAMVLGLAIMLGGYWAYGVLGWGGWWGWDPVENSSLVPVIIAVAGVHTFLVQKRTQKKKGVARYVKTNLILGMLTFILVIYSTFLTRSGILGDASVHSFTNPGQAVYLLLVLFIVLFTGLGLAVLIWRWKSIGKFNTGKVSLLSRELALFTGSITLVASAIIILVGTSAPIFGKSVEIRFYNELNLPIAIIIAFLNGFSLLLKWQFTKGKNLLKNSVFSVSSSIILTALIVFIGGVYNLLLVIFTLSTSFALFVNLEIAFKIIKNKKNHLGAYVAHFGIALFFFGIIASGNYSKEASLDLIKGKPVKVFGYNLTFKGYTSFDQGKKYAFNIKVRKGSFASVVSPVMFISDFNNSVMREPDILHQLTKDLYISPLSYEENSNGNSKNISLNKGESYTYKNTIITFKKFDFPKNSINEMKVGGNFFIGAEILVKKGNKTYKIEPKYVMKNGKLSYQSVELREANIKIKMTKMSSTDQVNLLLSNLSNTNTKVNKPKEILSVKASIKPFINLVWAGVLFMVAGFFIAVVRRTKESQI